MPLVLVGLSHHAAPVAVRERFSCADDALPYALSALSACPGLHESALLSTCNRMEIYAQFPDTDPQTAFDTLIRHLSGFHSVPVEAFRANLVCKADEAVAAHLIRVAGGLDSLVLGESQILGQVRTALQSAQAAGTARTVLNALFQAALAGGKRVQSETGIGRGARSVAGVAVGFAGQIFDLTRARVLLLGAGKTSELTAKHLMTNGVRSVTVTNRTPERAVALAGRLDGRAIPFEAFGEELIAADIVISSTSSPQPIVTRETLTPVLRKRRGRPLFFIDIALPRDIAPDVGGLEDVFLYNLDDLESAVAADAGQRTGESAQAEVVVAEEVGKFMAWYRARSVAPVIESLSAHLERLTTERLAILRRRLGPVSERDWAEIEIQMRALIASVARDPIRHLKATAGQEANTVSGYDLADAARALFGLEAETEGEAEPPRALPSETPPDSAQPFERNGSSVGIPLVDAKGSGADGLPASSVSSVPDILPLPARIVEEVR